MKGPWRICDGDIGLERWMKTLHHVCYVITQPTFPDPQSQCEII